jgi:hypothetical protein
VAIKRSEITHDDNIGKLGIFVKLRNGRLDGAAGPVRVIRVIRGKEKKL